MVTTTCTLATATMETIKSSTLTQRTTSSAIMEPAALASGRRLRASEAALLRVTGRHQLTIVATPATKRTAPHGVQTAGRSTAAAGVAREEHLKACYSMHPGRSLNVCFLSCSRFFVLVSEDSVALLSNYGGCRPHDPSGSALGRVRVPPDSRSRS